MGNGNNETYAYLITELYKEKWKDDTLTFREVLKKLHYDEGMSYREIARLFKVSFSTVYLWFKRENISNSKMKW